jgi:Family of unknown function (DUF6390)
MVFASFAYPPNALGYCGPDDPAAFLGAAARGTDLAGASALAARFDGAWPYLQLIAACNGITDPLDVRVVEAYWIGNSLLGRVPAATLVSHLDGRFERRAKKDFSSMAQAALAGGAAHHSFHVFAVYPWLGLLRAGMDRAPLVVLDQCRVRPGRVLSVEGDSVVVSSRSLVLDGHVLADGPPRSELVSRSVDGLGFSPDLVPGDLVALHWDWVCRRLSPRDFGRLERWTRRSIEAVNALAAPGPAVACEKQGA